MPVIINAPQHPFLPVAFEPKYANVQPVEITALILMAKKIPTELQLARVLGDIDIPVRLTFAVPDQYYDDVRKGDHIPKWTPPEHIVSVYHRASDALTGRCHAFLMTGMDPKTDKVRDDPLWNPLTAILDLVKKKGLPELHQCAGAHFGLDYVHGIERKKQPTKTWGVYDHVKVEDTTGMLDGLTSPFPIPVSRWNEIRAEDVKSVRDADQRQILELASVSEKAGVGLIVEPRTASNGKRYPHRVYILNHPEYDADTLKGEYARDLKNGRIKSSRVPENYFPDNDPANPPSNTWEHTARIYTNWLRTLRNVIPHLPQTDQGVKQLAVARS
jgi:homoserine O-succinyltransferase/O-acetyltransferase